MIRGYVSSDEDDYDDYDFGYSEPLIVEKKAPYLPEIQNQEVRDKIELALNENNRIKTFLNAIGRGDLNALEDLISQGVTVDCTDSQGWSPLLKACGLGEFEVVQFLLEHGADPNKHRELLTPLMMCCTQTLVGEDLKLNCVTLLLEYGAEVNAKDKFHTTALMYATGSGYEDIVSELLGASGVDVNMQDREGWTALFHAVNHNYMNLAETLMAAGTDLKLKDKFGRTVLNLALDKNLKKMAKILGYVEEETIDFKPKEELKDRFLKELPDSNGQGGFPTDAQMILHAFNQFSVKKISLPDLLNATEKDLYEVGVRLKPDRSKILCEGIHRFHLHPWKNSSLHQIKTGVSIKLEDAVAIIGSVAKHLTVANASLRYLSTRIASRHNKGHVNLAKEKEMIVSLTGAYYSSEALHILLSKLLKDIEQIKPEITADYVYPYKRAEGGIDFGKFFWRAFGVTTAAFFVFNPFFHHFVPLIELLFNEVLQVPEVTELLTHYLE